MQFGWIGADAPKVRSERFPWSAYGWAFGMTVAASLLDHLLFRRLAEANLIMVYLLAQVPVAMRGDRGAAIAGAVLSVMAFDWFFVLPFHSFAVSDTQYLFTFAVMGLVGTAIATLTARLAAEITEARQAERRARALYELSRSMLAARAPAEVLAEGTRVIGRELGLALGAWLRSPGGEPVPVIEPASALNTSERELLRWVLAEGTPAGPRTGIFPGSAYLFLPLRTAHHVLGALGLHFPQPTAAAEGVQAMLATGANQIAIALDQARAREEADQARAQADAERMRSALLSSVSHDLRTPLTGIVGAAGALVEGVEALDPNTRRSLATGIVEEAERLNRLVTNLLHATRLDAGAAQLARDWTSLEDVVGPALTRLATVLADHPVDLDMPAELPLIFVDPVLLEQVFSNLLENAAKYAPSGTPISVAARQDDGTLTVEVADRGPGLPPGEEQRAFEKFRRYPRGGAPGAGLGLAIARGVVEAHGGSISASNRPEGGAAFRFTLPLGHQPPL